eukprot:evm.model.NODE_39724_length_6354_cov_26.375196.1
MSTGVDGAGETKLKLRRSINQLLSPRTPATPPLSPDPSDCSDGEQTLSTRSPSQLQQRQMDKDEEETNRYN